jgi:O-antigen/teichoic acid export membrane protein
MIHPRQVLSAFGWSFAQSWGSQLTKLVVFIILARLLDARDIGLVAFAMVFIQGAQSFALTGVSDALIQKKDLNNETTNAVFWLNMLIASALAVALFFIAPLLEQWFTMEGLASVLRWICPVLFLQALAAVQISQFRRNLQVRPLALREVLAALAGGGAGVLAALGGWGIYALIVNVVVGQLLGALFLWWTSSWRPTLQCNWSEVRHLTGFALNRTGSALLYFSNTRLDDFFVGAFLGPVALGYYAVAYRVLQAITMAATGIVGSVAFPLLSRLQGDLSKVCTVFLQLARGSAAIATGLFAMIFVLAPQIVIVCFGEQWLPSVTAMRILCIAGIAFNVLNLQRALLRSIGRTDQELLTYTVQTGFAAVGFYFASKIGIEAVASVVSLVACLIVPIIATMIRESTHLSLKAYFAGFVAPIGGAAVAGAIVYILSVITDPNGAIGLMVLVSLFLTIYCSLIYFALRRDILSVLEHISLRGSHL